jgi:flagellar basal body rod protein FlgG
MLLGFYTGASGIYYNDQKLDTVANNLANAQTTGFRRSLLLFRTRQEHEQTKRMDPSARKRNPSFNGIEREGVFKNFEAGRLESTENPMDLSLDTSLENGFFAVKRTDPNDSEVYYTRNGSLSFGPLDPTNPEGPRALYMSGHLALDDMHQPIPVDPTAGPLSITPEGMLSQHGEVVAELPVFRFNKSSDPTVQVSSELQSLLTLGDSLFKIPPDLRDAFHPQKLEIQEGMPPLMHQGYREKSNVDTVAELMQMMTTTKAGQANMSAFQSQADGLTKLFNMIRT